MTPPAVLRCSQCFVTHEASTAVFGSAPPKPGSWSVCADCGGVSVFTKLLGLRSPTVLEAKAIAGSIEIANARAALAAVKAQREGAAE